LKFVESLNRPDTRLSELIEKLNAANKIADAAEKE
jgi:hypothetical protein